jgi:LacI family transcriptional regulator
MAAPRKRAVTVADVAALAGVSLGTVSKAINGRGQLRAETRARVIDAARELGFQPNLLAQGLVSGRTYTVGILSTDGYGRFTIPILEGAEDVLGPGEMSMLLCESRGDPIRELHYLRTLLARRVDGIIVTGRGSDPRPSLNRTLPIPVVYALSQSDDPSDVSVTPDDAGGAARAVEHLVAEGRRRIALIAGPAGHAASHNRMTGSESALRAAGLDPAGGGPLFGTWSEEWGREAVRRLRDVPVDALFCASDQIARGAVDELRENGRSVPDEVAVIGVDNWAVMAEASRPPLTTIDLDLREVGRIAATRLLEAIDGHDVRPGVELVACRLVVRASAPGSS